MPWVIQPQVVLVKFLRLAAKEHDKCNDNIDKATLTMTETTAKEPTTAATHGDGNHVDDKEGSNAGNNGNNNNGVEDSGRRRRRQ